MSAFWLALAGSAIFFLILVFINYNCGFRVFTNKELFGLTVAMFAAAFVCINAVFTLIVV